jgi:HEAT repeat protein
MKLLPALWLLGVITASEYEPIMSAMKSLTLDDSSPGPSQAQVRDPALTPPEKQDSGSWVCEPDDVGWRQSPPNSLELLFSPKLTDQYQAMINFRKSLGGQSGALTRAAIGNGVFPRLVEILAGKSVQVAESDKFGQCLLQEIQLEAAWLLANIASRASGGKKAVAGAGAVPVLIRLLSHPNENLHKWCILALGNIAADGPELCDLVLQKGMMLSLLKHTTHALDQGARAISMVRSGAWAISNLCSGSPAHLWDQIDALMQVFIRLLQTKDEKILVNCAWALVDMTGERKLIPELVKSKVITHLVFLLDYSSLPVQIPALRAMGNILTGTDRDIQLIVKAGGLTSLHSLLYHTDALIVEKACWIISRIIAGSPKQIQAVLDAKIIPKLVTLLASDDYKIMEEALGALCNATSQHETHPSQTKYLISQGVTKPLCDILEDNPDQRIAFLILDGLTNILIVCDREALLDPFNAKPCASLIEEILEADNIRRLRDYSELKRQLSTFTQALNSPELLVRYQATVELCKMPSEESDAFIQALSRSKAIPRLVEILAGDSVPIPEGDEKRLQLLQEIQLTAARALANIAAEASDATMAVVKADAIPVLVRLLHHSNKAIREQCTRALGNIAADGVEMRDRVLQEGVMLPLLDHISHALNQETQSISAIQDGALAISNLCCGRDPPPSWDQIGRSLQVLLRLLQVKDDETLVDCAWTLAGMTAKYDLVAELFGPEIVTHLVPLFGHSNVWVQTPALGAVGNIMADTDRNIQLVLDAGGLALLHSLLNHTDASIVELACWVISSITAGTPEQVQAVLDTSIVPELFKLLASDHDHVKEKTCWALCNITSPHRIHPDQIKRLVSQGIIKPLCDILENSHSQLVIKAALDVLTNILAADKKTSPLDPPNNNSFALHIKKALGVDFACWLQRYHDGEAGSKVKSTFDQSCVEDVDEEAVEE